MKVFVLVRKTLTAMPPLEPAFVAPATRAVDAQQLVSKGSMVKTVRNHVNAKTEHCATQFMAAVLVHPDSLGHIAKKPALLGIMA